MMHVLPLAVLGAVFSIFTVDSAMSGVSVARGAQRDNIAYLLRHFYSFPPGLE